MKWIRLCVITGLMLFAVQCTAVTPVPSVVKYVQPPNTDWSYSLSSEIKQPVTGAPPIYQSLMADDWECNATGTVTDIHWWGSYWPHYDGEYYAPYSDGRPDSPNGGITGFNITIWDDVPKSANNPDSHPGNKRTEIYIDGNPEVADAQSPFQITDGSHVRTVYRYDVNLSPNDQFEQVYGTINWISIQAIIPGNPDKQWGWHETTVIQNDRSVMRTGTSEEWTYPCGGHDMAFALTTVPEPAGILALLSGLGGILGVAFRRRK